MKKDAKKAEKDIFASDDDSEEDEDYVPITKLTIFNKLPPEDKNGALSNGKNDAGKDDESSEGATGIELIKRQKRQKEADDFFAEMSKEDPLMK